MFALDKNKVRESNAIITISLHIVNHVVHVLVDPGSSHSYMASYFAHCLNV